MTRRSLFAALGIYPGVGSIAPGAAPACNHGWVKGPFYVTVAVTYEEPGYYPPSGTIGVEHCPACGLLRLDAEARSHVGGYYNASRSPTAETSSSRGADGATSVRRWRASVKATWRTTADAAPRPGAEEGR